MFESVAREFRCRSIEEVRSTDFGLFVGGPGGLWLTEIVSVPFDGSGALAPAAKQIIETLYIARFGTPPFLVTIDWYSDNDDEDGDDDNENAVGPGIARSRAGKRWQCLLRFDGNNRLASLIITANIVTDGDRDPATSKLLPSSVWWLPERLKPFVLILACELTYREVEYEAMDENCSVLANSSSDWRNAAILTHMHGCILKILRYNGERDYIDIRRSLNGSLRYEWRDKIGVREDIMSHHLPENSFISVCYFETETLLEHTHHMFLPLADYNVFDRRCSSVMHSLREKPERRKRYLCFSRKGGGSMDDDDSRHLVNSDGVLTRVRFVNLSKH